MGKFVAGDIVIVSFPFSNLKSHKSRPALVVAVAEFDNLILCQITSQPYSSKNSIKLSKSNFKAGSLPIDSFIRPDKIFTADPNIISKKVGSLKNDYFNSTKNTISDIILGK